MIRAFLRVVRPLDWTGRVARVAMSVLTLMALVPVVLARLPHGWVELAMGRPWLVRLVLAIVVLWLFSSIRLLVYARLPRAVYLAGGRLVFTDRGRRRRVHVDDVSDVFVEAPARPSDQVFSVELRDGSYHELCPVDWPGAGPLYASLARKLKRRAAREARQEKRLAAQRR